MKKLTALLLVLTMMLTVMSVGVAAKAMDDNVAVPFWDNVNTARVTLNFSGTTGTASTTITDIPQHTWHINATLYVYRQDGDDWTLVDKEYGYSTANADLVIDFNFTAVRGETYKAIVYFAAYSEDGGETDNVEIIKTCP